MAQVSIACPYSVQLRDFPLAHQFFDMSMLVVSRGTSRLRAYKLLPFDFRMPFRGPLRDG